MLFIGFYWHSSCVVRLQVRFYNFTVSRTANIDALQK